MTESPRDIRDMLNRGEISPGEAADLYRKLHGGGEVTHYSPKKGRFNAIARKTFNHQLAYEHYEERKDIEEGFKHMTGTVFFGATGIIDGALEGVVYMATEIMETASFAITRSINRIRSGAERGWRDEG
jgi:hypothetical protein